MLTLLLADFADKDDGGKISKGLGAGFVSDTVGALEPSPMRRLQGQRAVQGLCRILRRKRIR